MENIVRYFIKVHGSYCELFSQSIHWENISSTGPPLHIISTNGLMQAKILVFFFFFPVVENIEKTQFSG